VKILIADDDRGVLTYLSAGLRGLGFEVDVALDTMQAVMKAMRTVPDAIVLDIQMPGGTGITALERFKASTHTQAIPVVVITGSATPEIRKQVLALGAAECLEKPVDVDALAGRLRALTSEPMSERTSPAPQYAME